MTQPCAEVRGLDCFAAMKGSFDVKSLNQNDAADAEAICEAVTRANMRFVETKTAEQQSCRMLHRTRQLFIRQQTSVINAIRAHMAEFGSWPRWDATAWRLCSKSSLM